jgi:hypothetical protein
MERRWLWLVVAICWPVILLGVFQTNRGWANQALGGGVVISEVAWGGTAANSADEWIELHNPTAVSVNLSGWTLSDGGDVQINLTGMIPADGFFLMERTDDDTVSDIPADQIYTGGLSNTGESLELRDSGNVLVDTANGDGGGWPAGSGSPDYLSMEREGPEVVDVDGNWHSNDTITRNGLDAAGNPINGTPRQPNSGWGGMGQLPEGTGELQWINLNYAYRFLHRFFYFNYRRTQKEFLPFQIRKSDINKQLRERLENLEFEELNKIMLEVVRRLLEAVDCYYFHTSGIHGKIRWSFVDYICLI